MKPFALHSVLRYRRQLEDAARRELHRALQAEARLLETLARVQADLAELYAGLENCHAGGKLARRQSIEHIQISDDQLRLVKSADHVFA